MALQLSAADNAIRLEIALMVQPEDLCKVVVAIGDQVRQQGVAHDACSIQIVNEAGTDFISFGDEIPAHLYDELMAFLATGDRPAPSNADEYPWVIEVWQSGVSRYAPRSTVRKGDDQIAVADLSLIDVPFSQGTLAIHREAADAYGAADIALLEHFGRILSEGFQRFLDIVQRQQVERALREAHEALEERVRERTVELEAANAHLRAEIAERRRAEAQRDEKDRLLAAFEQVGQAILSSFELDTMVETLAVEIIKNGVFRSLMVALVDGQAAQVRVVQGYGVYEGGEIRKAPPERMGQVYGLSDKNITAEVARTGEMVVIEGWDDRFETDIETREKYEGKVSYFIPVRKGDQVLAVLATGSRVEDKDDLLLRIETMRPLLDQVAVALEHAQVYRELRAEVGSHVRTAERLRASEQRLRNLAGAAFEGIVFSRNGQIVEGNQQFGKMFGYELDEIVGMSALDFVAPDMAAKVREHIATGSEAVYESKGRRKNGEIFPIEVQARMLTGEDGPIRATAVRDLTERKRMEEDLRKIHNLESLGVLAGGIAHDFNNMLTGVLANLALLEIELAEHAETRPIVQAAQRSAEQLVGLTRQLLTFAKGGEPVKEVADLEQLLREVAEWSLRGTKTRPEYRIAPELPDVEVDTGQIGQVVQNLVINADQAMPEGGVVEIAAVRTEVAAGSSLPLAPGVYVKVAIVDQGVGIPPEAQNRIFDPYYTTKETGHGLGLSIVHSIIVRHKGHIALRSAMGVGTTIEFYLPASAAQATPAPKKTRELVRGTGRILLVDDDAIVVETMGRALQMAGYEVESVAEGRAAISAYRDAMERQAPFDLVIMDLTIPGGLGGKEAIGLLLEVDPQARAVVASGYANDPVIARYADYGFAGRLEKPINVQRLTATVKALLASG